MSKRTLIIVVITIGLGVAGTLFYSSSLVSAKRNLFVSGSQDEIEIAKGIGRQVLSERLASRGVRGPDEFSITKAEIDRSKYAHVRFRQTVGGLPVWGGEAIVHLKADGDVFSVTDDLKESPSVNTEATFSPHDAILNAKNIYKRSAHLTDEPVADLWIYRGADRDQLAYRVQMRREDGTHETAMPVIFIDAHTGEKVFEYDNLQTGTGASLYSGTVAVGTTQSGSQTYYLENNTRKVGTFDSRHTTSSAFRFTDADDLWNSSNQRAAVDAQYGAESTMDYYQSVHGRNGLDGNGGPAYYNSAVGGVGLITSRVHYSTNYNNAFWNGQLMTYGDGDGVSFTPLVTLDICGHEMTHGVTERTAELIYSGESGALNESMSDIFGTMVERYARPENWNWRLGEDAYTPANGTNDALRYLDDPHSAPQSGYTSDDDPDHYVERYTGSGDNGGVHINSGIGNKAFYLLAEGGTHHRGVTVTGIGADEAAAIWYLALTQYMTSTSNFVGARTATLNAAEEIFGTESAQYESVGMTWCAVGVGACPGPTPSPTPTPSELLENGAFEITDAPWVRSGPGSFYISAANDAHAGSGYIYFGVKHSVTGSAYQQVSIPATASGDLTFWLNVTSNERGRLADDKLYVEVRNTHGALLSTLATYSNLNTGTAGVYIQRSGSLAAYVGQTVRLQFRTTTNSSLSTTFRVDDVSLE